MFSPDDILRELRRSGALSRFRDLEDDLIAEAVAAVFQRYPELDTPTAARVALTIARNVAIDRVRKRQAERRATEQLGLVTRSELGPVREAVKHEEQAGLARAMFGVLTPDERELLLQHFYRGISLRRLAEQQGVSHSTLASRLKRALDAVRAAIDSHGR